MKQRRIFENDRFSPAFLKWRIVCPPCTFLKITVLFNFRRLLPRTQYELSNPTTFFVGSERGKYFQQRGRRQNIKKKKSISILAE